MPKTAPRTGPAIARDLWRVYDRIGRLEDQMLRSVAAGVIPAGPDLRPGIHTTRAQTEIRAAIDHIDPNGEGRPRSDDRVRP